MVVGGMEDNLSAKDWLYNGRNLWYSLCTNVLRLPVVVSLGDFNAWLISDMNNQKISSTRCGRFASKLKAEPAILAMLVLPIRSMMIPLIVVAVTKQV